MLAPDEAAPAVRDALVALWGSANGPDDDTVIDPRKRPLVRAYVLAHEREAKSARRPALASALAGE